MYLFFFSSRRRHTRYIGDWSSDVCSSDLGGHRDRAERSPVLEERLTDRVAQFEDAAVHRGLRVRATDRIPVPDRYRNLTPRSEERRVGKECIARRLPYHSKKNTRHVCHSV